jgi:hypothetical protein
MAFCAQCVFKASPLPTPITSSSTCHSLSLRCPSARPANRINTVHSGHCHQFCRDCSSASSPSLHLRSDLCLPGAPLFLSHPHFYNADPVLAEAVLGLSPNSKEHSLFLDIHPVSAVPCL